MLRLAVVPGLLALAACAADTGAANTGTDGARASAGAGCFTLDDITGYSRADFDTVYVETAGGAYRLELAGACGDMAWTGAVQRSPGTGHVCTGFNPAGGAFNVTGCQVTRTSSQDAPPPMTPMPANPS